MPQRTIRDFLLPLGIVLASSTIALAQSGTTVQIPTTTAPNSWHDAQYRGFKMRALYVVTSDRPDHKQPCHVQSFTEDKLVCSGPFGRTRTYLPQQIASLIIPGDGRRRAKFLIGFNSAMGAAIWGTVVLVATCPVCAAATALAAFLFFDVAAVILIADDQPDRLLYLAPGQQLTGKLRNMQQ